MVSLGGCNLNLLLLSFTLALISMGWVPVSSRQFIVGGERGWTVPANQTGTYNHWASANRFQIGDTLYFKYSNDSVIEVEKMDYTTCNATNPIAKYDDGETVFKFDRFGFFQFISGNSIHCKSGQKLIVQVMGHSNATNSPAMPPSSDGATPTPSPTNSGVKSGGINAAHLVLVCGVGAMVLNMNRLFI